MSSVDPIRAATLSLLAALAVGCEAAKPKASSTFYERRIGPILTATCSNSPTQSGCHVPFDDRGNALGNLDLSTFEGVARRRDLLVPYGPYSLPGLLVKALPPFQVRLTTWESPDPIVITTDIPHAGGSLIDVTSTSYNEILQWITRGATENNAIPRPQEQERSPCATAVGSDPDFDPSVDPSRPDFGVFTSRVNPLMGASCAAGNCHGSPTNSLYLTCGETPEQTRWNYFAAGDYVSVDPEASELLRRTLSPSAGGTYHEGGTLFPSTSDQGYRAILEWAEQKGGPENVPQTEGFLYFAHNVQPMLVKKGCTLLGCHSPAMGHDYRLRSGSGGHFGLPATRRNYAMSLEQVALESPDPNTSRILRKNLAPFVEGSPVPQAPLGILHRGGSLFGSGRTDCDAGLPATDAGASEDAGASQDAAVAGGAALDREDPYCVIRRWIELERRTRMADALPLSSIVYVRRPRSGAKNLPQDFATFHAGADLLQAPLSRAADGTLTVGAGTSLLAACGIAPGGDVRRPAVSWDGRSIAFSTRAAEDAPWRVYVSSSSGCALEPTIATTPVDDEGNPIPGNGELVHDFDPAFAPDGRLVFASTRGNVTNTAVFAYQGPQRSPADPSRLNANLYVAEGGRVRQLTFLLNQEMTPSFMSDGRLIMVTEKRAPGFYQLAGRRQNLDGADYHPLFGQRSTVGFRQVTDIVELPDKTLAAIFSDQGASHEAGALGVINRSIGVDQRSPDPEDYLQDPGASTWQNPAFFQRSIRMLDGSGKPGVEGGAYRNPAPLPDGRLLVSYAGVVPDLASFGGGFSIVVVNPITGERSGPLLSDAEDLLWPVAVYARPIHGDGVYRSKLDEPNGATQVSTAPEDQARAEITFLDVPMLSSLLFQNTRSRRVVPSGPSTLELWEDLPPPSGVTSYEAGGGNVVDDAFGRVYVRRRNRGTAPLLDDGSLRVTVPGGIPIVLAPQVQLVGDDAPTRHHQLEQLQFYPGEKTRFGFRRELFDGVCGSCHGSVSGYEHDVAVNPDILTQASRVDARKASPVDLTRSPGPEEGPPFP